MSEQNAPKHEPKQPKGTAETPKTKKQQPPPQKYQGIGETEFYQPLHQKSVVLALTDGKIYSGTLEGVDRFHLILQTKQGLILFSKHAIKYVYAGKKPEPEHH